MNNSLENIYKEVAKTDYKTLENITSKITFEQAYLLLNGYNKSDNYFNCRFANISLTIYKNDGGGCYLSTNIEIWKHNEKTTDILNI